MATRSLFPPGYRFRPEDDELIYYLKMRINNEPIPIDEIRDANAYGCDPKKLIAEIYPGVGEGECCYFFSPRERKYPNGSRPNRKAGDGYWKASGADKKIEDGDEIVGFKKVLVFFKGEHPDAKKTKWIMHEYRLNQPPRCKRNAEDMRLDDWVLCRIYERATRKSDENQEPTNYDPVTGHQNDIAQLVEPHSTSIEAYGTSSEAHCTTTTIPAPEQLMPAAFDGDGCEQLWVDNAYGTPYNCYQPYDGEGTSTNYYDQMYGQLMSFGNDYGNSINYPQQMCDGAIVNADNVGAPINHEIYNEAIKNEPVANTTTKRPKWQ